MFLVKTIANSPLKIVNNTRLFHLKITINVKNIIIL